MSRALYFAWDDYSGVATVEGSWPPGQPRKLGPYPTHLSLNSLLGGHVRIDLHLCFFFKIKVKSRRACSFFISMAQYYYLKIPQPYMLPGEELKLYLL